MVGLSMVGLKPDIEKVKEAINFLKDKTDWVIVNIHWGEEYDLNFNKIQKEIAYQLIDDGADVIIGHHPHVVQEVEVYKGRPIFYSLGNFIFDQMWSEETKKGAVVELTFLSKGQSTSGRKGTSLQGRVPSGTRQGMKTFRTYIRNWGQVEFVD